MSVTQALNSKANVKKTTNQDLPFSPQQAVISSYYATSTLSQTVINLSFSVDQTLTDQFFLFIDGKKLRLGSTNDYTFTSIGSDNTSTQVTINYSIPANLNIQAYILGLKKESEFLMDNRFTQLYAAEGQAFQGFISPELTIAATTTTGSPVAGTFYSNIQNRAQMMDLSQDLKPRMAVDRIMIQGIYQILTEFGANGEPVYGTANDIHGRLRFVGNGWQSLINSNGSSPVSVTTTTTTQVDYLEIVFYGTGINLLSFLSGANKDYRYAVDGGTESSNLVPLTYSGILTNRNYAMDAVVPVVSGLTLGTHTVKIRNASTSAGSNMDVFGIEILNESNQVRVNPGISYNQGKKYTSASQSNFTYNSMATGTRGGRTVVYQNGDGSISTAWQAVNAAQANLTSADHTNEEISRVYHWREFGAARADDFSTFVTAGATNLAFTLDDGTTTLSGLGVARSASADQLLPVTTSGNYIAFTFVGTGLDLIRQDSTSLSGTDTFSINVDGTSVGTVSGSGSTTRRQFKVVSGLPYGTHVVRIQRTAAANTWDFGVQQFVVYQPKKPTVPTGAVELADYNVMATYVANTVAGIDNIATGILRKGGTREFTYIGTYTATLDVSNNWGGWAITSTTNADTIRYSFFGTGFELRTSSGAALTYTINVDGSTNLSGFTTSVVGTNIAITPATGTVVQSVAAQNGQGVQVSNLALAMHTVILTKTAGASGMAVNGWDIICPIHSAKSNTAYDQQNTLLVGSQGISDNRKLTPIKDSGLQTKNINQAVGVVSNPTTTSTAFVPMPDMSVVHTNRTGRIKVTYSASISNSSSNTAADMAVFVDGVQVSNYRRVVSPTGSFTYTAGDVIEVPVSPTTHKVDVYWKGTAGTAQCDGVSRTLLVEEN